MGCGGACGCSRLDGAAEGTCLREAPNPDESAASPETTEAPQSAAAGTAAEGTRQDVPWLGLWRRGVVLAGGAVLCAVLCEWCCEQPTRWPWLGYPKNGNP